MSDLISREAVKTIYSGKRWRYLRNRINKLPAVDAIPVVRCKDCKDGGCCEVECLLREVDKIPDPYCAAGKRRADDGSDVC